MFSKLTCVNFESGNFLKNKSKYGNYEKLKHEQQVNFKISPQTVYYLDTN